MEPFSPQNNVTPKPACPVDAGCKCEAWTREAEGPAASPHVAARLPGRPPALPPSAAPREELSELHPEWLRAGTAPPLPELRVSWKRKKYSKLEEVNPFGAEP